MQLWNCTETALKFFFFLTFNLILLIHSLTIDSVVANSTFDSFWFSSRFFFSFVLYCDFITCFIIIFFFLTCPNIFLLVLVLFQITQNMKTDSLRILRCFYLNWRVTNGPTHGKMRKLGNESNYDLFTYCFSLFAKKIKWFNEIRSGGMLAHFVSALVVFERFGSCHPPADQWWLVDSGH